MQPGPPWNPYPPPPPSRAPWAILVAVALIVLMMFGAMAAGAFFFLLRTRAAAPPRAATWSPPAVVTTTPIAPTATVVPTPTSPTAAKLYAVLVGSSPAIGKSDALVTLVEFGDFQCPFCRRAASTVDKLRAEYGADLRVVWKNNPLPFHPNAVPAAELALEARAEKGDAAFWSVHDDLYATTALDQPSLLAIARARGVSEVAVQNAIATKAHQAILDADAKLATDLGASGTPTFFVNGRMVVGAQPITKFEATIEEALADAKARVAAGTRRARVYDAILRDASARGY